MFPNFSTILFITIIIKQHSLIVNKRNIYLDNIKIQNQLIFRILKK